MSISESAATVASIVEDDDSMRWLRSPLVRALRDPASLTRFDEPTWDLLLRQAGSAGLLGRLQAQAIDSGVEPALPASVRRHMNAAQNAVQRQTIAVHWEVKQIARALGAVETPVVLLKGAAYAAANLPAALGRVFSDIDILVPKSELDQVERALLVGGWVSAKLDPYDQRYYRRWMHELPPMQHIRRRTPLDVHHNILPETARIKTRPELILDAALPLSGYPNIFIPSPPDQVLHSATHLFHEGEWGHGLRDLSDLDLLLRSYGRAAVFWPALSARAAELNLQLPLRYALRCTYRIFHTPIPAAVQREAAIDSSGSVMDSVFLNAFASAHHSLNTRWTALACSLLYVRSHWLRMPPHLLLPHLLHQALPRRRKPKAQPRLNDN